MFDALDISSSALSAQRVRMDAIAQNIANINTTRNARGQPVPFHRRFPVFRSGRADDPSKAGVRVEVRQDKSVRKAFEPFHADADKEGNVSYPNIDLAVEYVNALEASRAYEANVTAMEVTKAMINASLRLLA
jgi:flagellar basal-body rod protein FlgC